MYATPIHAEVVPKTLPSVVMKWGISFKIDASLKTDLWAIPPPSMREEVISWDEKVKLLIVYQFKYSPQSSREWNRVASIKEQLGAIYEGIEFEEFEPCIADRIYTITELGKHFRKYAKFPKPFIDGTPYRALCRYAKRLHYEKKLHLEQLVSVSFWIATLDDKGQNRRANKEGARQCFKRAVSAHLFALEHSDEWKQKLDVEALVKAHKKGAAKSAAIRRERTSDKKEKAILMKKDKRTYQEIASTIGVSLSTIKRWFKK